MPDCCAACGVGFDARTRQQQKMLRRIAHLGATLAEIVAASPALAGHVDVAQNFELLRRGVALSLALEAKLTDDLRKRHRRRVHGAPGAGERDEPRARRPHRAIDTHSPALAGATIRRDLDVEEDVAVFLEPMPTRDAASDRQGAQPSAPRARDVANPRSADPRPADVGILPYPPLPVAKGRPSPS